MTKSHLYIGLAALAAGYFLASSLAAYQPFKWAAQTGASAA